MNRNQRLILLGLPAAVVVAALIVLPGGVDEEGGRTTAQTATQQQPVTTPQTGATRTHDVSFDADIEGVFEIELEHSGTKLATLEVEPR